MWNILRVFLAGVVGCLALYSLITNDYALMPYWNIGLAILFFLNGIDLLRRERGRAWGYFSFFVALLVLYVAIDGFMAM